MSDKVLAPGIGRNMNKRLKAYIGGFVFFIALSVSQILLKNLVEWKLFLLSGGLALLVVSLGFFALNFKGNLILFLKLFFMPFMFVSLMVFTLRQVFFTQFERIADVMIFALVAMLFSTIVYGLLLTVNVLYIASLKSIPLVQVAHSVWYILTLAVVFIFTYWSILSADQPYYVLPAVAVMYFLLILQHLSHFELSDREIVLKSLGIMLGMASVVVVTAFWPTPVYVKAFAAAVSGYIGLGIVMHELKKVLLWRVYFEYGILLLIFLVTLIITSDWGIFGGIL
jgi:hypothetical protein